MALSTDKIGRRVLVGKNVCHRCKYDENFDGSLRARIAEMPQSQYKTALQWVQRALSSSYGGSKLSPGKAKKLHDPLAFATLLDENVCVLREVSVGRKGGHWGSVLCDGTRTFAAVDYSSDSFLDSLFAR
uniref:Uncharacterized protein n=1 Tax=Pseudictyota dubia TaxID=2749911 RepID=A0A7R9Z176_9STRA